MERAYEKLIRYAGVPTASVEGSDTFPSSADELDLARLLVEELTNIGAKNVTLDENGYVFAEIPETVPGKQTIGFIAHMDTVDCVPWKDVKTSLIENYDGGDITLANGEVVSVADHPTLAGHAGKTMLVTDGNTLLGADDKAGIAEIMCMAEKLLAPDAPAHGKIMIGFTPDEEIGRGPERFDIPRFGADFAYTVDGGELGDINNETFNAASGVIKVTGVSTHPGGAKGVMLNAALIACEFAALLPEGETPARTAGYDGFYHLCGMEGDVEHASMDYIIRDHSRAAFEAKKAYFLQAAELINARHGGKVIEATVRDQYYNMVEVLKDKPEVVDIAREAFKANGIEVRMSAARGGTDGCTLTYHGLPCPNLSTCGMGAHGRHEMVPVEDMDKMADVLVSIALAAPDK